MAPVPSADLLDPGHWSNDDFDHGIVDLYTRRMELAATERERARIRALEQRVVTQPFGRAFTAQPVIQPEPEEPRPGFRERLASVGRDPRRRLATS